MEIRIQNITKRYGDTTAVNDLTLTLDSGKLVALLGPSGCGKSTLLNMLSGIVPATDGRIYFDGRDVTDIPPDRRGVGMVFQHYALYPHMTVVDNICFPLENQRMPRKQRRERAMELARLTHIEELLDRKPAQLSGGQQQRVAIARALAKNPAILLLDEPLSNLDANLRIEMREEIRRIQRDTHITTVFVTHDQEEASSIADSIVLFRQGVLQQYGKPRELYADPASAFVAKFLGTPPINEVRGRVGDGRFRSDDGQLMWSFPVPHELAEGAEAVLSVRPESIRVRAGEAVQRAVVKDVYELGKDKLAALAVGKATLRCFIDDDTKVEAGEEVPIGFKPQGVFLFDARTGARFR
ncbi:ABC transporter ATP-binding protein [Cohnella hongkongensis]|uniref:ABC transporter ATP-binding protein n=1 Tax=Cohnella hongkongensis TaxID=178337 RepID=A0ABV9FDM7_9BACL